jgi:hypothetical protein
MANWIEFEFAAEAGDSDLVEWISLANKTVTYYSNGTGHDVTYVDQAAALLAYNEWLIAHPPEPVYLEVGDIVRVNRPLVATSVRQEQPVTFLKAPAFAGDYWVFDGIDGIYFTSEPITVVKVT